MARSVGYPEHGGRFLGATFDPSGLYRLAAVFDWLTLENITVEQIHLHARASMKRFLDEVEAMQIEPMGVSDLVTPFGTQAEHGNFLTFRTPRAAEIEAKLANAHVHCDHRGDRLRFGFGICTNAGDVDQALARVGQAIAD